ncbi:MAG: hypothetical protein JW936_07890 [Sedimentisphaerales bacterium]|nr:hypothetical protein [Sedimentisphaerales bacterium]
MNNEELKTLQNELGLTEAEARQMAADIQAGDELLDNLTDEPLPAKLVNDITSEIDVRLSAMRLPRRSPMLWLRRIAAVIAVALAGLSVWYVGHDEPMPLPSSVTTIEPTSSDADRQLWDFALTLGDEQVSETNVEMDAATMTDLLLLFDDADLSASHPLGKEPNHESSENQNYYLTGSFSSLDSWC